MWPLMIGLFVCAEPLVSLLLGQDWLPCVPFVRIFSLYYALFPIHTAHLNAIKAMAMFIRRYGKKDLAAVLDRLHQQYDFQKIQEILGFDLDEGLRILEETRTAE